MSSDRRATWRAPGTKVAHHTMREVNRSLVLDILREGEPVSRVELSRRTSLSKPTVSSIVEDLLAAGLVRDAGPAHSGHTTGRPATLLVYDERALGCAALEIRGGTVRAAVADGLGRIMAIAEQPVGGVAQTAQAARQALRDATVSARMRADRIVACGVVVDAGETQLDWRDPALRQQLEHVLRTPVVLSASSHAAALAELRALDGAVHSLAWVHAGDRIDCALVVDGQVLGGAHGDAGAIAHLPAVDDGAPCRCGGRGCLETVAAGEVARRAPSPAGEHLGRGIAQLVAVLDPDVILLAGPLAAHDGYLQAVEESARRLLRGAHLEIRRSVAGEDAALLGAVQLATGLATPSYRVVGHEEVRGAAAV